MSVNCLTAPPEALPNSVDQPYRLITATEIRLSEIISALSVALDLTQGHSQGHCMRAALIGMRLAEELRLSVPDQSALFYALLLKDSGCSSNAAKIAYLFRADDQVVKHSLRMADWTRLGESLSHCWKHSAPNGTLIQKFSKFVAMLRSGPETGRELSEIRCERGAKIARMLALPDVTARAVFELDEHWDGGGNPQGLKGEDISLLARICGLAQTVEVFFSVHGLGAALDVARQRRGKWFDPQLVNALLSFKDDARFWNLLKADNLVRELGRREPEDAVLFADESCLDRVAAAFAKVVDAKSPWTFEHSTRVATITVGVARQFGCPQELERDLHRAALLHDLGKLGVSNLILDKPGKPTEEEFQQIRKHPEYTQRILEQVPAFSLLADVAGAHHERLDGRGYYRGLGGEDISWPTRVLTVADIYEALSAKRPYRDAMEWDQIRNIMRKDAGSGVDADCLCALEDWHDHAGDGLL